MVELVIDEETLFPGITHFCILIADHPVCIVIIVFAILCSWKFLVNDTASVIIAVFVACLGNVFLCLVFWRKDKAKVTEIVIDIICAECSTDTLQDDIAEKILVRLNLLSVRIRAGFLGQFLGRIVRILSEVIGAAYAIADDLFVVIC